MLNSVVFDACEMIQTFAVVFCVFRAVNKFAFRLVTTKYLANEDQWREDHVMIETIF
jgi:hypothetical protein